MKASLPRAVAAKRQKVDENEKENFDDEEMEEGECLMSVHFLNTNKNSSWRSLSACRAGAHV